MDVLVYRLEQRSDSYLADNTEDPKWERYSVSEDGVETKLGGSLLSCSKTCILGKLLHQGWDLIYMNVSETEFMVRRK